MSKIYRGNDTSWLWFFFYGFGASSPPTTNFYTDVLNDVYTDNAGLGYTDIL